MTSPFAPPLPPNPFERPQNRTDPLSLVPQLPTQQRLPTQVQPFIPGRQRAIQSLERRVNELGPLLEQLPPEVRNAWMDFNVDRAQFGQMPMSEIESLQGLRAALTGEAQTKPREDTSVLGRISSLPRNAYRNLREIGDAIPHMVIPHPNNPILQEALSLRDLPQNLGRAVSTADNPAQALSNIAATPGVRMTPGAYVVEHVAGGTPGELLRNPIFTALDVLPFAAAGASRAPVVRAARAQHAEQVTKLAQTPLDNALTAHGTINPAAMQLRQPGAFRTLATRKLVDGEIAPNRFGSITEHTGNWLRSSSATRGLMDVKSRLTGTGADGQMLRGSIRLVTDLEETVRAVLHSNDPRFVQQIGPKGLQALSDVYTNTRKHFDWLERQPDNYLSDLTKRFESGDFRSLSSREKVMLDDFRTFTRESSYYLHSNFRDKVVLVGADDASRLTGPGARILDGEMLTTTQFNRLRTRQKKYDQAVKAFDEQVQRLDDVRAYLFGDEQARATAAGALGAADMPTATRSLLRRLDEMEFSTPVVADLARRYKRVIGRMEQAQNPTAMARGAAVLRETLSELGRRREFRADPELRSLIKDARAELRMATRQLDQAVKSGTPKNLAKRVSRQADLFQNRVNQSVPARYMPRIFDEFDRLVRENLDGLGLTEKQRVAIRAELDRGEWAGLRDLGLTDKQLNTWRVQARQTWTELKASGVDPLFLHKVDPNAAVRAGVPQVAARTVATTPRSIRARTWDRRPSIDSPQVSMTAQMREILEVQAARELAETVGKVYGVPESRIREMARAAGRSYEDFIEGQWVPWKPEQLMPKRHARQAPTGPDSLMVPKILDDTLRDLHRPSKLDVVVDPVMRTFRTAVLPLSPRWHVYNVLGGAILMALKEPLAFRHIFGEARRAIGPSLEPARRALRGEDMQRFIEHQPRGAPRMGTGASAVTYSDRVALGAQRTYRALESQPVLSPARVTAVHNHAAGAKLREIWDQVQAWKAKQPGGKTPFGRTVNASHALNNWWDDIYRSAAAIEGYNRATRRGARAVEAELEAARASRSVMQSWDELLPMERMVMRTVFPFYSWARFSLGFALRFPFDHPIRASLVAGFAEAELDDQATGLPRTFQGLFQLTPMDERGNADYLRVSGFNPFRDAADWMTLEGFLGNANPVITATAQALGVDTRHAGPILYPNLRYDEQTGGLTAERPSFMGALITSTIPQTRLIDNFLIGNDQFARMMERNPNAARSTLLSQMGIPVLGESKNVPQALMRAEMLRQREFGQVRQRALREGDLGALERYDQDMPVTAPGGEIVTLGEYLTMVREAEAMGALDAFRPQVQGPEFWRLLNTFQGIPRNS